MSNSKPTLTAKEKMAMAAGAVTAIGGATAADAAIVYVDNNPLFESSYNGNGSTTNWDVDGDGGTDFQLWVRSSTFFSSQSNFPYSRRSSGNFYGIVNFASADQFNNALGGRGLVGMGGFGNDAMPLFNSFQVGPTMAGGYQFNGNGNVRYRSAARVDSNFFQTINYNRNTIFTTTVSGGTTFYYTYNTTSNFGGFGNSGPGIDFSNFVDGQAGFLGFSFETNGELFYGWAELIINGGDLTITRWAYEDIAGLGIHVGQTSTGVPEPATLALLGMGAAGLLALRGRREKKRAGQDD